VRVTLARLIEQHGQTATTASLVIGRSRSYLIGFLNRGSPQKLSRDAQLLSKYFGVDALELGVLPDLEAEAA